MAALCVLLTAACWYDYRKKKIPNALIIATLIFGAGWRLRTEGIVGVVSYLGQAVMVIIPLYFLFRIGVVGAGDIKLFGVTAGFLPFKKIFLFLFVSLLVAAMVSLLKLWNNKNMGKRLHHMAGYLSDVMRSGWRLYPESGLDLPEAGICLSGPILVSLLLYLGGVY